MGSRNQGALRFACTALAAIPLLGGCSRLLQSGDADFRNESAGLPEAGASESKDSAAQDSGQLTKPAAPACKLLASGPPRYLKAPTQLRSAMFGGQLAAAGQTLVTEALFETPDATRTNGYEVTTSGKQEFCSDALLAVPSATKGVGATRIFENSVTPVWELGHAPDSAAILPEDQLDGRVKEAVLPTHPSAIDSSWLAIGDAAHNGFHGAVRYWPRNADGTVSQEYIIPYPHAEPASFGRALALDGNTLIVGAPSEDSGEEERVGAAYVYELAPGDPRLIASLHPAQRFRRGWFGSAMAISRRWIVVAAPGDDVPNEEWDSTVYVFERHADGVDTTPHVIKRARDDYFLGSSVALHGDWLAIGAPGAQGFYGRVFMYHYSAGEWLNVEERTLEGPGGLAFFGWSLAFAPGAFLVTAPWRDPSGGRYLDRAGSLFVYAFDDSAGVQGEPCEVFAPNPSPCDNFGNSLAVGSNFVAVGAPREDGDVPSGSAPDEANGLLDTGAVYVYPGNWAAQSEP